MLLIALPGVYAARRAHPGAELGQRHHDAISQKALMDHPDHV